MVALGLFLLLLSGGLTAVLLLQNTDPSSASVLGESVAGTTGGLFLAGVITGAVAVLSVLLMLGGLTRRSTRRRGLKHQVRAERGEKETLAEENARLRSELESNHTSKDVYPEDPVTGRHADADTARGRGLFHR